MELSTNSDSSLKRLNIPVWLFQFNPNIYDIDSALRVLSEVDCVVEEHLDQIREGHRVLLWKGGKDSALVAVGTVIEGVAQRKPIPSNLLFYKKAEYTDNITFRILLRIDKVFDRPVPKEEFAANPVLKDSLIIMQPDKNNYPLNALEHSSIEELLASQSVPIVIPEELEVTGAYKPGDYVEPPLEEIIARIKKAGIRLDERLIRRYHLAMHSRGFVILAGLSGTGKTWLSKAYADAVQATYELVCVAPNWNSNESLLGYLSPFKDNEYVETTFSIFLRRAADAYLNATEVGLTPRPFHVVLDEMNLARVEYYFALFLSKMEERARSGIAKLRLGKDEVLLTPNLYFIGTVNVDETTHGFSDKVFDRAQLIELEVAEDLMYEHIGNRPYRETLMNIWRIIHSAAPFSFRVVDDIIAYVDHAEKISASWQEAFDEQITQKVLPKVRGNDAATERALKELAEYCKSTLPFTYKKIKTMLSAKEKNGSFSFFT